MGCLADTACKYQATVTNVCSVITESRDMQRDMQPQNNSYSPVEGRYSTLCMHAPGVAIGVVYAQCSTC
jgi:hypothetical protein